MTATTTALAARLSLVMITKNEPAIATTIASARSAVDRVTILDTGSSDGTRDLAESAGARVFEGPFVDFSSARNRALEIDASLGAPGERWIQLMLCGDDELVDGEVLRAWAAAGPAPEPSWLMRVEYGRHLHMHQALLTEAGSSARYHGVTHEVILPVTTALAPGRMIAHPERTDARARRWRWELDLTLLEREVRLRPLATREAFYLAQTLDCLADGDADPAPRRRAAIAAYRRRIELGGWHEEVFESHLRIGRLLAALGEEPYDAWNDALRVSPHRAEPLVLIAEHALERGLVADAAVAAVAATLRPFPARDVLFVDPTCYHERAFAVLRSARPWGRIAGIQDSRRLFEGHGDAAGSGQEQTPR